MTRPFAGEFAHVRVQAAVHGAFALDHVLAWLALEHARV